MTLVHSGSKSFIFLILCNFRPPSQGSNSHKYFCSLTISFTSLKTCKDSKDDRLNNSIEYEVSSTRQYGIQISYRIHTCTLGVTCGVCNVTCVFVFVYKERGRVKSKKKKRRKGRICGESFAEHFLDKVQKLSQENFVFTKQPAPSITIYMKVSNKFI